MSRQRPVSPESRFARALDRRAEFPRPVSFVIPTLAADPPDDDPTNLWMRFDGRLRGRYRDASNAWVYVNYPLRTDITSPPAVPAYPAAPALPPAPMTYQNVYTATWSQGYKGDGSLRTDSLGTLNAPFGNRFDGNGTQRSLIGFDYATIATDLASSTIYSVSLALQLVDSTLPQGADLYFGIHNETAAPSVFPDGALPASKIASAHFTKGGTDSAPLPLEFAVRLRAGTGKGIAIEAPSSAGDFYGIAAGVGSGYFVPQLTITFAK
jgi:hypothetical protein